MYSVRGMEGAAAFRPWVPLHIINGMECGTGRSIFDQKPYMLTTGGNGALQLPQCA